MSNSVQSRPVPFWVLQEKQLQKDFTKYPSWGGQIFSHKFLVVPECPIPLLGRDLSLPSKSCGYCNPDRRCFKTLSWGQAIFTSHQVKQLLNGKGHLWMADQRILRYQVVLIENPGLTISPCEVLNPVTLLNLSFRAERGKACLSGAT